mmetsp:Transcript_5028/g.8993  ORF Transcript_5028/g.8993 Transcript_5028/m.8993 type:complete len:448 (-) Transcript_5028:32-1375(-)
MHYTIRIGDTLENAGGGDAEASVLGGFNFILGFLIVFRSQQAYTRWLEGGTLLQQLRGEWFNSFSCLMAFCSQSPEKREEVRHFQQRAVRLFSLLYGCALQQVATMNRKNFELISINCLDKESLRFLQTSHDRCEIVLQWIQRLIVDSDEKQTIKVAPPILSRVFNELGNGIVNLNNARKIRDFPIPFHLAQMITVMLLTHSFVTPVICAATIETMAWAGIISFTVSFSYWCVHFITIELEMPFGDDSNDLPLHVMQRDMNQSLAQLLDKRAQEVPQFDFDENNLELELQIVDFDAIDTSPSTRMASKRLSRYQETTDIRAVLKPMQEVPAEDVKESKDMADARMAEGTPSAAADDKVLLAASARRSMTPRQQKNAMQDEATNEADLGRLEAYLAEAVKQLECIAAQRVEEAKVLSDTQWLARPSAFREERLTSSSLNRTSSCHPVC